MNQNFIIKPDYALKYHNVCQTMELSINVEIGCLLFFIVLRTSHDAADNAVFVK